MMKYRVGRGWLLIGVGVVFLLGTGLYQECCVTPDRSSYHKVVGKTNRIINSMTEVRQQRKGVKKELSYGKDHHSLHMILTGSEGEFIYVKTADHSGSEELIERISNLKGWMQEELFVENGQPMQKVRVIEADTADYSYLRELLVAQNVKTALYILPGHTLREPTDADRPIMKGVAKSAEITFVDHKVNFKAQKFRAELLKE